MYISRALLLLLLAVFLAAPSLLNWIFDPSGSWYRPYLIWLLIIFFAFIIHHKRSPYEF